MQEVVPPPALGDATLVSLACADDDAQGQPLSVMWECEPGAGRLEGEAWGRIGTKGFDDPALFAAYMHTLRWNCVTATDPTLFQAPFRAGIKIDAYQLEPLRKALALPRVNLFIADDVGLGKTIEAGLIARELLLRRRIDAIVVAVPPSMLLQWQDEMEARFGLTFVILDRAYLADIRRERGYGINPWKTHSRFLISHRLLIDETYVSGLRDWLGGFRPRSLLILDEAHHAAPSSGGRYAIDSQITRAMRDLAPRFEHRLFLSATPHNGHSNSFAALLEILDSQRFVRGIKVRPRDLEKILVRRLKDDIRELEGGFPKRIVDQVDIVGLPEDAPELVLAALLDRYRTVREERLAASPPSVQRQQRLVLGTLQQRLLSSVEAFARTIRVHLRTLDRLVAEAEAAPVTSAPARAKAQYLLPVDSDDDRAALPAAEVEALEDEALAAATAAAEAGATAAALRHEAGLVRAMVEIAERHRDAPDARVRHLLRWIDAEMCRGLPAGTAGAAWNARRVIVFTEWEDTRRYVERRLRAAIDHTDRAEERIAVFTGSTPADRREELKRAFNTEPTAHPLRILICTDAAREGLNLQRHCRDLFHFDLPWNPSRIEQRNGRIDRKLQPAAEVVCHYFFYRQRPEDRVLQALVRKSETIREELGSMAQLLESRVAALLDRGIRRDQAEAQAARIRDLRDDDREAAIRGELEEARERRDALRGQIGVLQRHLERSEERVGFNEEQFRRTVSLGLTLAGAPALTEAGPAERDRPALFRFPADDPALARDGAWAPALDLLRAPKPRDQSAAEWRRKAAIRPVAFEDTGTIGDGAVQLHLEHRVAKRLLSRFASQGLVHFDLSRACLASTRMGEVRVVLLGRLALYGPGASRLHEELIPVTARWDDPAVRRGPLTPYGERGEERTLAELEEAFLSPGRTLAEQVRARLLAACPADLEQLLPHLEQRAAAAQRRAEVELAKRAEGESAALRDLLAEQRKRIEAARGSDDGQLVLDFSEAEARQRREERRAWDRRLVKIAEEIRSEPDRVAAGYTVQAVRLEPVGLVYLWPATG